MIDPVTVLNGWVDAVHHHRYKQACAYYQTPPKNCPKWMAQQKTFGKVTVTGHQGPLVKFTVAGFTYAAHIENGKILGFFPA